MLNPDVVDISGRNGNYQVFVPAVFCICILFKRIGDANRVKLCTFARLSKHDMTQTQNPHLLETEPIGKLLLQYSIPAIIGMTVVSLYNIVDSIFIGHGVGPLAISGLALTFPLMNMIIAFCTLIGVGGAAISSIFLGQKDNHRATEVLHNVAILCVVVGILVGGITYCFLDKILYFFGASEDTLPYARDFMEVILLGNPISYLFIGLNNVMRATGYPKKAMLSSILSVGVNVVLAPIFIFSFKWGIRGAALATLISQACGMVWVLTHFSRTSSFIHFRRGYTRLKAAVVGSIFSIGMSPFLMNLCACGVVIVINHEFKTYGGDLAIGAYGIANRVVTLFFMVVLGLAQGMQPIVGYNYGARRYDRMRKALRQVIAIAVGTMTVGWLLCEFLPAPIVAMFSDDEELNELSKIGLQLSIALFPLVGAQAVITNFFQSIGKVKLSILLSLTRQLLFLLPLLYILPQMWNLGINGVWLSMPVSDFLAFVLAAVTLRWYFRKLNMVKN